MSQQAQDKSREITWGGALIHCGFGHAPVGQFVPSWLGGASPRFRLSY